MTKLIEVSPSRRPRELPHIGWREFVALPDLGIARIKAKIDTGARSSALHATRLRLEDGRAFFEVRVGPAGESALVETPLLEMRRVRSSSGSVEERPVIRTRLHIGTRAWMIDLTLTDRSEMGFELLLGRQALRNRFLADPGRSYLWGR